MLQVLTILKESLWSAAASRLLYVELVGVLLGLIALLPMGYVEKVSYELTPQDISSTNRMAQFLVDGGKDSAPPSVVKQLWGKLESEDREAVQSIAEFDMAKAGPGDPSRRQSRRLAKLLNSAIENTAIEDFDGVQENASLSETKELFAAKDSLTEAKEKRLRRLILQEAFRGMIRPPVASTVAVYYAVYGPYNLPGMSHSDLENLIRSNTPWVLDKIFLTVGILIAILVTASLIPQMLEEGSLYLQLSKPIPRWLLLVTKYFGSGILILVISASLLTGLWLILGLRMSMWINELLWFIPLAVGLYLIYYSVTVGVGLLFRNAIIAILATVIFGGICYSLSVTVWFSGEMLTTQRRGKVLQMGDKTFTYDSFGKMHLLKSDGDWEWVFFEQSRPMPDMEVGMMSSFYVSPNIPKAFFIPDSNLVVGEISDIASQQDRSTDFAVADLSKNSMLRNPVNLGSAPDGLVGFALTKSGELLGVSKYGSVWQLSAEGMERLKQRAAGVVPTIAQDESAESPGSEETESKVDSAEEANEAGSAAQNASVDEADSETEGIANTVELGNELENELPWELVGVINETGPESADRFVYDAETDVFWGIGRQLITRAERVAGAGFEIKQTFKFPWKWSQTNRTPIQKVGNKLVVPLRQGPVVVLNADTLEVESELALPFKNVPVSAATDGHRVAIAYLNDGVWMYDAESNEMTKLPVGGMGLAVDFDDQGQLVIVRDVDRLEWLDPETGEIVKSVQPNRSSLRWIYEVIVKPLHTGLPKPSECYSLVTYLATQESDEAAKADGPENQAINVDTLTAKAGNPWNPILSSFGFAAVVMCLNCLYFSRQQF